jgi:DNA-binding NarL/FixJ family response regulator
MSSSLQTPVRACSEAVMSGRGALPASRLVICDPASLWAEAIEAVVLKHTAWQVACITTRVEVAVVAAAACAAHAVLFDTSDGSQRAVAELVDRFRCAKPGIELVLVTGHTGVSILRGAIEAGVSACLHKSEPSAVLAEALRAVRGGEGYRSPTIVKVLAAAQVRVRATKVPTAVRLAPTDCQLRTSTVSHRRLREADVSSRRELTP